MIDLHIGDTQEIIKVLEARKTPLRHASYILATAYWETNRTMRPVVEAYWLSEEWRRKNLRYYPWFGRGYVQLTWEENYIKAGKRLGTDFTKDPDKVMQVYWATRILVIGMEEGWFTGKKLSQFKTYKDMRPIVNGDSAKKVNGVRIDDLIADYAVRYQHALTEIGYGEKPKPATEPIITDTPSKEKQTEHWFVTLLRIISKIWSK